MASIVLRLTFQYSPQKKAAQAEAYLQEAQKKFAEVKAMLGDLDAYPLKNPPPPDSTMNLTSSLPRSKPRSIMEEKVLDAHKYILLVTLGPVDAELHGDVLPTKPSKDQ